MQRVLGLGGVFFRSTDPVALARWYAEHLGVDNGLEGPEIWQQQQGPTILAPFPGDTDKFGDAAIGHMLNFRVADLDAMLEQLRTRGVEVEPGTHDQDGVGRFGWLRDPEGNRVELWEPDAALADSDSR